MSTLRGRPVPAHLRAVQRRSGDAEGAHGSLFEHPHVLRRTDVEIRDPASERLRCRAVQRPAGLPPVRTEGSRGHRASVRGQSGALPRQQPRGELGEARRLRPVQRRDCPGQRVQRTHRVLVRNSRQIRGRLHPRGGRQGAVSQGGLRRVSSLAEEVHQVPPLRRGSQKGAAAGLPLPDLRMQGRPDVRGDRNARAGHDQGPVPGHDHGPRAHHRLHVSRAAEHRPEAELHRVGRERSGEPDGVLRRPGVLQPHQGVDGQTSLRARIPPGGHGRLGTAPAVRASGDRRHEGPRPRVQVGQGHEGTEAVRPPRRPRRVLGAVPVRRRRPRPRGGAKGARGAGPPAADQRHRRRGRPERHRGGGGGDGRDRFGF
mmetsp:Transcript_17591/g.39809  ORF Transcript_17591/g.39809 Transcript_17591/m.39809 type:complete len:372 (-) Transcript_17591:679-1794(-)